MNRYLNLSNTISIPISRNYRYLMKIIRMIDSEMVMFLCKSMPRITYVSSLNRNWQRVSDWNSVEKQYMSFVLKLLSSLRREW